MAKKKSPPKQCPVPLSEPPIPKKMGRPLKEINWKLFEELCFIQCTNSEIASVLDINEETLYIRARANYQDTYPSIYKRFAEGGKSSLRRYQFNLAKKNTAMAIWLGKMWLGQSDKDEVKELVAHVIQQAVIDIEKDSGNDAARRSTLAHGQSVLDQRFAGKSYQVQDELGPKDSVGRSSSMQDSPESSTAGDNNVFVPPVS